ncbi:molybdopterin-dependent oxidoreductase [Prauserella cavernicola]|uniref:Molybdopterin-dependent oxidoreductase n=1 Tax=Prauserella cavernicola TaxID=2800127 RepID=A0A934QVV4_9PSEU|nr:molybdopterin-dependent oxidoreductase [Prauserella cavernicola]MBK1787157.1 molybdopterin-dependent oxidoreductase [Prauserella cavernicola]
MEEEPTKGQPRSRSAAHDERVTARIGLWLAISFGLCFATGLLSHLIQHPPSWFTWPSRPVWLYRVTQGTHVISGIASIPLLLAKLWSVYPKLFERPVVRSVPHAVERLSILVLSASVFFELTTGLLNVAQNYPWNFYFPTVHYAVAWIAVGSLLVHIAVKLPVVRRALERTTDRKPEPKTTSGLSRRGFLRTTLLSTGAAVLATAGATVPWLRDVSVLSWRSDNGPQGVPVNRTAAAAGVLTSARDPEWRLEVVTSAATRSFTLAELRALPQTTAELPIACVEGWSANATWTGVALPDLLRATGAAPGVTVKVTSLENRGLYSRSTVPGEHTADPLTLLALDLNGGELDLDHGYPCRIIAPNRPGVLQTKWVRRLEVVA